MRTVLFETPMDPASTSPHVGSLWHRAVAQSISVFLVSATRVDLLLDVVSVVGWRTASISKGRHSQPAYSGMVCDPVLRSQSPSRY